MLRYACACLWEIAPVPMIPTLIGPSILSDAKATMEIKMHRHLASFAAVSACLAVSSCSKAPPAGVAASVNGRPITYTQLEKTYKTQYSQQPQTANADLEKSQKLELLGSLITN